MTWTTTIEKSGRIKLPDEFLERREILPGHIVRIVEQPDGRLVLKIGKDTKQLIGKLGNNGIHLSIEDINRIIAEQGLKK